MVISSGASQDESTSVMLKEMASNQFERHQLEAIEGINPVIFLAIPLIVYSLKNDMTLGGDL